MYGPVWLKLLRSGLLIALLGFFLYSITASLLAERGPRFLTQSAHGDGRDPGVRVLLLDHQHGRPRHRELEIRLLQACTLVTPDNVDGLQRQLPPGTMLRFTPEPAGQMIIHARGPSGSGEWTGNAGQSQRLHLYPVDHARGDGPRPASLASFEATDQRPVFALGERAYRGNLAVVVERGGWLYAVNALPIEAYVAGVLQSEMGGAYPRAALRAQAIVARGFAYARGRRPRRRLDGLLVYHLSDAQPDPAYHGAGSGDRLIDWAARDTRGQILTARGAPFVPHFHASSGSRTASISELDPDARTLDGTPLAQLDVMISQPDAFCKPGAEMLGKLESHWYRVTRLDRKAIGRALKDAGIGQDWWLTRFAVDRHPSNRVASVIIDTLHRNEPIVLTAERFRQIVGPDRIPSTLWSQDSPREVLDTDGGGKFIIESYGLGHGVGMSQVSAYAMGQEGYTADEILAFFYLGARVETWW